MGMLTQCAFLVACLPCPGAVVSSFLHQGPPEPSGRGGGVASPKRVVILGPIEAGTHLLMSTLQQNFPAEFNATCLPTNAGCSWIWKHSLGSKGIIEHLKRTLDDDLKSAAIVAVVRSPLSLAHAWTNEPWDLQNCVWRPWSQWNQTCQAALGPTVPEQHQLLNVSVDWTFQFKSTMHVYMSYLWTYRDLMNSGLFADVLVVRYEDLLLAPGAFVQEVGRRFHWPVQDSIEVVEEPLKRKGTCCSREEEVGKVLSKAYLKEIGNEGIEVMCRSLKELTGATLPTGDGAFRPDTANYIKGIDIPDDRRDIEDCDSKEDLS